MKNLLRKKAKSLRNTLDSKNASKAIVKKILFWSLFREIQNIMLYYPIQNEINLLALTECPDKKFYLPKIADGEIYPAEFVSLCDLKPGCYNINEPSTPVSGDNIDMIFIPALMADGHGHRLGYGKGYYDRFLNKLSAGVIKVIPVYDELFLPELPVEEHDEKVDYVILKERIIKITSA
jgi:5-formyltetrahydrofolate cyclo-ligase